MSKIIFGIYASVPDISDTSASNPENNIDAMDSDCFRGHRLASSHDDFNVDFERLPTYYVYKPIIDLWKIIYAVD